MSEPRVAVVGATGAVGPEVLSILAERGFPASEVVPFASARSAGTRVEFAGEQLEVRELTEDALAGFDLALFSAGGSTSKRYAPEAVKRGCMVVDKSSAFRMDPQVPLIVPEVNPDAAAAHQGIVSNPNCSTIQLVVALKPLHDAARIRRLTIATYQAVSGTGKQAMEELSAQSQATLQGDAVQTGVYPHPIAFNVLPHCDVFDGPDTAEETKLVSGDAQDPGRRQHRHQRHVRAGAGVAVALRGGVGRDRAAAGCSRRAASCCARRPACASSTTRPHTRIRCRRMPPAATTCWSAASATTARGRTAWRSGWSPTTCARAPH